MARVPNSENFNRLSRVHERYRQTTDGRAIAYSEHEREFAFAKKRNSEMHVLCEVWWTISTTFMRTSYRPTRAYYTTAMPVCLIQLKSEAIKSDGRYIDH